MTDKEKLVDFLHNHNVASIATISNEGRAHATTIYYYVDEDFAFYFVTKSETIKYKNIKNNNNVALVITDVEELQTVQVEGNAFEITDTKELSVAMNKISVAALGKENSINELPISQIKEGQTRFFKITHTWIKWDNFKNNMSIVEFEENLK